MSGSALGTGLVAVVIVAAAALAWAIVSRRRAARSAAHHGERIAASRVALVELRRRFEAGEIGAEGFEEDQHRLVGSLLADTQAAGAPGRPSVVAAAVVLIAAAAGGAFFVWSDRGGGARPAGEGDAAGDAAAPPSPASAATGDGRGARPLTEEQLQRMVERQRDRVEAAPNDAAAWAMLAHSYDMLGNFTESSKAYATLAELLPNDAQVLTDYADALAVRNGRSLAGEPARLIERALVLDPKNVKALALAGTAAHERKASVDALAYWERALAAGPDPAFRQQIEDSIATVRAAAKAGASSGPVATVAKAGTAAASGPAVVSGRATLAAALVDRAPPDATVFIFARPAEGSRMPVALLRRQVRDLPMDFTLDDSTAMVASANLSSAGRVVVGARVSMRGDVTPQPGDMQGWSAPVPVGTRNIRLEISEVMK